jgi:hypothetical protein
VSRTDSLLLRAIARNANLVLSLRAGADLTHHRSRFLSETPGGFWVAAADSALPLVDPLIAANRPVGVSFRSGAYHVKIATHVRRHDVHRVDASTRVPALLLGFHPMSGALERRNVERVGTTHLADLAVPRLAARRARSPRRAPDARRRAAVRPHRPEHGRCRLGRAAPAYTGGGRLDAWKARAPDPEPDGGRAAAPGGPPHGRAVARRGRVRHVCDEMEDAASGASLRAGVQFTIDDDADGWQAVTQLGRLVKRIRRANADGNAVPETKKAPPAAGEAFS